MLTAIASNERAIARRIAESVVFMHNSSLIALMRLGDESRMDEIGCLHTAALLPRASSGERRLRLQADPSRPLLGLRQPRESVNILKPTSRLAKLVMMNLDPGSAI